MLSSPAIARSPCRQASGQQRNGSGTRSGGGTPSENLRATAARVFAGVRYHGAFPERMLSRSQPDPQPPAAGCVPRPTGTRIERARRRASCEGNVAYHCAPQMDATPPPAIATLLFRGGVALPAFRRERLVERARALVPSIAAIDGCWVYFARASDTASGILERLGQLLDASYLEPERAHAMLDGAIVVTPRPGTVSPLVEPCDRHRPKLRPRSGRAHRAGIRMDRHACRRAAARLAANDRRVRTSP